MTITEYRDGEYTPVRPLPTLEELELLVADEYPDFYWGTCQGCQEERLIMCCNHLQCIDCVEGEEEDLIIDAVVDHANQVKEALNNARILGWRV